MESKGTQSDVALKAAQNLTKREEDKPIETEKFIIRCPGDPSVGIFDANWEIEGPFYFYNESEKQEFVDQLKLAWEIIGDGKIHIATKEEYDEELRKEDEWINQSNETP